MIKITQHSINYSIIQLSGRVDTVSAPLFREQFAEQLDKGEIYFIVDMSAVSFLDSSGLAALVQLLKRSRSNGGDVKIILPEEKRVHRILKLSRFDRVFEIIESTEIVEKVF